MKTTLERFALGLLIAPLAPIALLMAGWWLAYERLPEAWIPWGTLIGLALGLLADLLFLKQLLERAERLSPAFWAAVLLFYSVGTFGFFMGVPVFNAALAVPAGFVVGGRMAHRAADRAGASPPALSRALRAAAFRTCLLTTALLALVCAASAAFALLSPSTPSDLEGMLGLGFHVTPAMLWGLILVGGAGLLAVNWALTALSVRLTYRWLASQPT
jgi:hypothetical protein